VQLCTRVLVGGQGFSDAERLAHTRFGQFNQAYLTNLGISDTRVQQLLLKLHRKLRQVSATEVLQPPQPICDTGAVRMTEVSSADEI
jgi:hypothetical protein